MEIRELVFLLIAGMTLIPCLVVAFSRNILYSAFALFFTFLGASGLYFFLSAEFLAVVQLMIYIGGVLVLLLFAILLTKNIDNIRHTNMASLPRSVIAGVAVTTMFGAISYILLGGAFPSSEPAVGFGAAETGRLLLTKYLLLFEAASVLLLAVLVAGLVISGRAIR